MLQSTLVTSTFRHLSFLPWSTVAVFLLLWFLLAKDSQLPSLQFEGYFSCLKEKIPAVWSITFDLVIDNPERLLKIRVGNFIKNKNSVYIPCKIQQLYIDYGLPKTDEPSKTSFPLPLSGRGTCLSRFPIVLPIPDLFTFIEFYKSIVLIQP